MNTSTTRVWYKQDDEFLLPKANLKFEFISSLAYLDPLNCGLTYLFVQVLKDSLNEYGYDARLAGLKWNIINTEYGLMVRQGLSTGRRENLPSAIKFYGFYLLFFLFAQLTISGYNDKQGVLLDKILERMTNFQINSKRFELLKEIVSICGVQCFMQISCGYLNYSLSSAYSS